MNNVRWRFPTQLGVGLILFVAFSPSVRSSPPAGTGLFARSNLVAWCIVPFDAKKRGPEERGAMLEALGLRQLAYDWRNEHVASFDAEVEAMRRHGVAMTAWWFPQTLDDTGRRILDVCKRQRIAPQLWVMGGGEKTRHAAEQAARIESEAARLLPIARAAAEIGANVGLYNHGGWFGETGNQLALIERLGREGATNVGIVLNLHHAHDVLEQFALVLEKAQPHLLAVNLNGMARGGDRDGRKILPLGQGEYDLEILRVLRESGWRGPIGVLNHTDEDAEARLRDNLAGLDWLLPQLEGQPAGPAPTPRSWRAPVPKRTISPVDSLSPAFGNALAGGQVVTGRVECGTPPLTVECRARIDSAANYNILVSYAPKALKSSYWGLFTPPTSGDLAVYIPNAKPDHVRSTTNICDGLWRQIGMVFEPQRVRLFVDGAVVADQAVTWSSTPGAPPEHRIGFGRLVEGGLGCDGAIDDVRIQRGVHLPERRDTPVAESPDTLGRWDFDQLQATPEPPRPAPFLCDRKPLQPEDWPDWNAFVNRERLFDFYAKEARHFGRQNPRPALVPEYPGLDSGFHGHWGNQTEEGWRDDRWSKLNLAPLMCGVFRGGGMTIPKAVCVSLGEAGELSTCFDPEVLDFRLTWRGGFVGVGATRAGMMEGLQMRGDVVETFAATNMPPPDSVYRGFFRHGKRTVFAYRFGGEEYLDAAWCENGNFIRQRTRAAEHPLRDMLKGGPAQWPQVVETRGTTGTGRPYAVDTLTLPHANPWQSLLYLGGHGFFANGDVAICTMQGDVWRVSGVDETLAHLRWKRMASGIHQALGLVVVDDLVCVLGRDQITRLHDLNGDGEADQYECLANNYVTSPNGHDFICGLERDAQGRFLFASSKQGACRIAPGGSVEVLATGFRNPDGIGLGPDGAVTIPVSEGEWTPASAICQIEPGGFYGSGGPKPGIETQPPLVYLPRGLDNSSGGQTYVDSHRWGPLGGQMLHFSFGAGSWFLVLKEKVEGQWQGAAVPMPGSFLSGAHRGRFSPKDGQLYVSGMSGWGTYTVADGSLQRVRYTGGPSQFPTGFETHDNGVLLRFSEPLDRAFASDAAHHFVQCWNYRYASAYGSPEFSVRHPGTPGHDVLDVTGAHVLADGKSLFLEIPQLQPAQQIHLHAGCDPATDRDLFLTAHKLGPAFTNYPGYRAIPKQQGAAQAVAATVFVPNPWTNGPPGRVLHMAAANGLQFSVKELHAKAGERLTLTFTNPDVMPHNWALLVQGSMASVGEQANRFIADPRAVSRHYVPDIPEVLAYTDMVNPGGAFSVHFNAPKQPGDYPYICTFPGHWMLMNGVMHVAP